MSHFIVLYFFIFQSIFSYVQETTIIVDEQALPSHQAFIETNAFDEVMVLLPKPNEKGISHSYYSQFDVGKEAVILNNSREDLLIKEGLHYQKNSFFDDQSAQKIILEVKDDTFSSLAGDIHVWGDQADLIFINPEGIFANGARFFGMNDLMLSTGAVIYTLEDDINSFALPESSVVIGRHGLDVSSVPHFEIWANRIKMLGALVSQNVHLTVIQDSTEDQNENMMAFDASCLHTAIKSQTFYIALEGNSWGINLPELMVTDVGDVVIDGQGDIILKDAWIQDDLIVNTDGQISFEGQMQSKNASIKTDNRIAFQENSLIFVDDYALFEGNHIDIDSHVLSNERLDIHSFSIENSSQGIIASPELHLTSEHIKNDGGLSALEEILISSSLFENKNSGWIQGERIFFTSKTINNEGKIFSPNDIYIASSLFKNDISGELYTSNFFMNSDTVMNNGHMEADNLRISSSYLNNEGYIGGDVINIESAQFMNDSEGRIQAIQLDMSGSKFWKNTGYIVSQESVQIVSPYVKNNSEGLIETVSIGIESQTFINSKDAQVMAQSISVKTSNLHNRGRLISHGYIDIEGRHDFSFYNLGGLIYAEGHIHIQNFVNLLNYRGFIGAQYQLFLDDIKNLFNLSGVVYTRIGDVRLNYESLVNTDINFTDEKIGHSLQDFFNFVQIFEPDNFIKNLWTEKDTVLKDNLKHIEINRHPAHQRAKIVSGGKQYHLGENLYNYGGLIFTNNKKDNDIIFHVDHIFNISFYNKNEDNIQLSHEAHIQSGGWIFIDHNQNFYQGMEKGLPLFRKDMFDQLYSLRYVLKYNDAHFEENLSQINEDVLSEKLHKAINDVVHIDKKISFSEDIERISSLNGGQGVVINTDESLFIKGAQLISSEGEVVINTGRIKTIRSNIKAKGDIYLASKGFSYAGKDSDHVHIGTHIEGQNISILGKMIDHIDSIQFIENIGEKVYRYFRMISHQDIDISGLYWNQIGGSIQSGGNFSSYTQQGKTLSGNVLEGLGDTRTPSFHHDNEGIFVKGDIRVISDGDIQIGGYHFEAKNNMSFQAKNNIEIHPLIFKAYDIKKEKINNKNIHDTLYTVSISTFKAGHNISFESENADLIFDSVFIESGNDMSFYASQGKIQFLRTPETLYREESYTKQYLFFYKNEYFRNIKNVHYDENNLILKAGGDIRVESGGGILFQAPQIIAHRLYIDSHDLVTLDKVSNIYEKMDIKSKKNPIFISYKEQHTKHYDNLFADIQLKEGVFLEGNGDVIFISNQKYGENIDQWASLNKVEIILEKSSYHEVISLEKDWSLGAVSRLAVGLIVSHYIPFNLGEGLFWKSLSITLKTVTVSFMSYFIEDGFNVLSAAQSVLNKNLWKSILSSLITFGIKEVITPHIDFLQDTPTYDLDLERLSRTLKKHSVHSTLSYSVKALVNLDYEHDMWLKIGLSTLASTWGEVSSAVIGDLYEEEGGSDLNWFEHKILHFLSGSVSGWMQSKPVFLIGFSQALGEIGAEWYVRTHNQSITSFGDLYDVKRQALFVSKSLTLSLGLFDKDISLDTLHTMLSATELAVENNTFGVFFKIMNQSKTAYRHIKRLGSWFKREKKYLIKDYAAHLSDGFLQSIESGELQKAIDDNNFDEMMGGLIKSESLDFILNKSLMPHMGVWGEYVTGIIEITNLAAKGEFVGACLHGLKVTYGVDVKMCYYVAKNGLEYIKGRFEEKNHSSLTEKSDISSIDQEFEFSRKDFSDQSISDKNEIKDNQSSLENVVPVTEHDVERDEPSRVTLDQQMEKIFSQHRISLDQDKDRSSNKNRAKSLVHEIFSNDNLTLLDEPSAVEEDGPSQTSFFQEIFGSMSYNDDEESVSLLKQDNIVEDDNPSVQLEYIDTPEEDKGYVQLEYVDDGISFSFLDEDKKKLKTIVNQSSMLSWDILGQDVDFSLQSLDKRQAIAI